MIQKRVLDLCIAGTNLRQRALCQHLLKTRSVPQIKDCLNLGTASRRADGSTGETLSCSSAWLWERVLLCILHGALWASGVAPLVLHCAWAPAWRASALLLRG